MPVPSHHITLLHGALFPDDADQDQGPSPHDENDHPHHFQAWGWDLGDRGKPDKAGGATPLIDGTCTADTDPETLFHTVGHLLVNRPGQFAHVEIFQRSDDASVARWPAL